MPEKILLVDDDLKMKGIVADVLQHEGYDILTATNGQDALEMWVNNPIDLALLDIKLPDIDGTDVLRKMRELKPTIPVVMISGHATIDSAVRSTRLGAYDFLEKPLEPRRVLLTIRNALEKLNLERVQEALIEDMMSRYGIVGVSASLRTICSGASRIAKTDAPVLITGENGTGKELIAMLIHRLSGRGEFVCMNCAAVPQELIESEIFGHKKGSFTGALGNKMGKFQAADGGTLFLDEIGDMSYEMQAKILRALETREVCPVGEITTTKVDVRFITATNKDLPTMIREKMFREDLYYRLRGVMLHLLPLRNRREDIKPLARYYLARYCSDHDLPERQLTDGALTMLGEQPWYGNVRELKHFIENMVIFSEGTMIDHLHVLKCLHSDNSQSDGDNGTDRDTSLRDTTHTFEKNLILKTLQETEGNISHAAERLHIDRATLSKKIKRYGLKP